LVGGVALLCGAAALFGLAAATLVPTITLAFSMAPVLRSS
jgi:hypothetical protein